MPIVREKRPVIKRRNLKDLKQNIKASKLEVYHASYEQFVKLNNLNYITETLLKS